MMDGEQITAYCPACQEPAPHALDGIGSCACIRCGTVQALVG